ncbi:CRISPR-associated endonuclease Cas2 [Marinitenerispora sediminis]|uniref:CRISPR-associated endoribonuclease Cas2 n=1 Tax=Marinitenerispora sediminis TaxID=1931232 RepID=A0A368T1B8_9ACTN|nr:CRISPR-associated endonuclease Cas2 [Marinitenerispora sediminis]RCV53961.1 CRISPR-associated endonuclease Cas2 [Marinitenerispora sediminis]RCV57134.1 CRISPR-associated endonuclease Cas2 [Marinitenerispora sediminis]RCV58920.1 CRISPR-associated endonuclease Cas2 [Marinitenerispora sediminis]
MQLLLLTYDVNTTTPEGRRRLRTVAQICEGYGRRVQKSVFEIISDEPGVLTLIDRIGRVIDDEADSIRVYRLPPDGFTVVRTLGAARAVGHNDAIII